MKYHIGIASILLLTSMALSSGAINHSIGPNLAIIEKVKKDTNESNNVEKSEIICILGKKVQCIQYVTFQAMHFFVSK